MTPTPEKSPLAKAIEAVERPTWSFETPSFLSKGMRVDGTFRMRVPTAMDLVLAKLEAKDYLKKLSKESGAENDPDLISTVGAVFALQRICWRSDKDFPVFDAEWMLQKLTNDELTVLLNLYQECIRLSSPLKVATMTSEETEGLCAMLANVPIDQVMDELARFTPSGLALLTVQFAQKVHALKTERVLHLAEVIDAHNARDAMKDQVSELLGELETLRAIKKGKS